MIKISSIIVKRVGEKRYVQFIKEDTIIHCGSAKFVTSWSRAYKLFTDEVAKATNIWVEKHKPIVQRYMEIKSERSLNRTMKEIQKGFPRDKNELKWLEKKRGKLSQAKSKVYPTSKRELDLTKVQKIQTYEEYTESQEGKKRKKV